MMNKIEIVKKKKENKTELIGIRVEKTFYNELKIQTKKHNVDIAETTRKFLSDLLEQLRSK